MIAPDSMTAEGIEKLRDMALAAIGKDYEAEAFGKVGAAIVAELCAGWLKDDSFDPYDYCCCGQCA